MYLNTDIALVRKHNSAERLMTLKDKCQKAKDTVTRKSKIQTKLTRLLKNEIAKSALISILKKVKSVKTECPKI